jgi:hypothetical protein
VSLYYYVRIVRAMFIDEPLGEVVVRPRVGYQIMLGAFSAAPILFGIWWTPIIDWTEKSLLFCLRGEGGAAVAAREISKNPRGRTPRRGGGRALARQSRRARGGRSGNNPQRFAIATKILTPLHLSAEVHKRPARPAHLDRRGCEGAGGLHQLTVGSALAATRSPRIGYCYPVWWISFRPPQRTSFRVADSGTAPSDDLVA